ncbi:hypothetical protein HELRODRAFT_188794 [Helobdella robusta]|uniref:Uncharacterized protein n=1 Tax=Helobdella robusta TaxID=6412 RepID=T1FQD2_HELRO|nr:hypothetical protein HELRODRAFT_188794 [Helobdella robusta]ESO02652.1 hypothetical protein HELRODRAFT_188794 [Helobdella robusta]
MSGYYIRWCSGYDYIHMLAVVVEPLRIRIVPKQPQTGESLDVTCALKIAVDRKEAHGINNIVIFINDKPVAQKAADVNDTTRVSFFEVKVRTRSGPGTVNVTCQYVSTAKDPYLHQVYFMLKETQLQHVLEVNESAPKTSATLTTSATPAADYETVRGITPQGMGKKKKIIIGICIVGLIVLTLVVIFLINKDSENMEGKLYEEPVTEKEARPKYRKKLLDKVAKIQHRVEWPNRPPTPQVHSTHHKSKNKLARIPNYSTASSSMKTDRKKKNRELSAPKEIKIDDNDMISEDD